MGTFVSSPAGGVTKEGFPTELVLPAAEYLEAVFSPRLPDLASRAKDLTALPAHRAVTVLSQCPKGSGETQAGNSHTAGQGQSWDWTEAPSEVAQPGSPSSSTLGCSATKAQPRPESTRVEGPEKANLQGQKVGWWWPGPERRETGSDYKWAQGIFMGS